jgi:hypothetical protein
MVFEMIQNIGSNLQQSNILFAGLEAVIVIQVFAMAFAILYIAQKALREKT